MIILIAGASHTGKTNLSQQLMERLNIPYISIDHIKMGLIRSKVTELTPYDDEKLTPYLWSIVKEIIKTAIENEQNLIVEGCYIPFDFKKDFSDDELSHIRYVCLVMSESYITDNFQSIVSHSDIIEKRISSALSAEKLIADNKTNVGGCEHFKLDYYMIDKSYNSEEMLRAVIEIIRKSPKNHENIIS